MADEPQNYPPADPQQALPVTPTQAYPAPQRTAYTSVTPVYQQTAYTPMPQQAKPIRKNRSGSAALVWLLGGCGVLAVIFIVGVAYFAMTVGSTLSDSTSASESAQQNLREIRASLDAYTRAHHGRYPASLDEIVDADSLVYTSQKGAKVYVEYTPPNAHSEPDAGVAGFFLGDMNMGQLGNQKSYVRLLKNGAIVREQIGRTPL